MNSDLHICCPGALNKHPGRYTKKMFYLLTPHAKINSVQPLDVRPVDSNWQRDSHVQPWQWMLTHCHGCTQHSAGQLYQKSLWSIYMFLHAC